VRRAGRLLVTLTVCAGAALAAAGCSNPPAYGFVHSVNYNPPWSYYVPGYDDSWCSGSGKYRNCYDDWIPGRTVYVPAEWQLDLCQNQGQPSKSNSCGWRDVDPQTYHSVRLGQFWTSVAGASPSSSST
jgi:hypothetical protein